MAQQLCAKHEDRQARWSCGKCRQPLCNDCIREEFTQGRWLRLCRICGGACQPLQEALAESLHRSFCGELPRALVYPLLGHGRYIILAGAIVFFILGMARQKAAFLGMYLVAFVQAVSVVCACIVPAYVLDVIRDSAAGQDEPPDWPTVSNWLTDLARPVWLILAVAAISFLPAAVFRVLLFHQVIAHSAPAWACLGLGLLYFPMAMLSVTMFDSLSGASPAVVVPAIAKTAPAYLAACAAMGTTVGAWVLIAMCGPLPVPIVGPILGGCTSIYFLMLLARICGLIYWFYRQKLGWFPEA